MHCITFFGWSPSLAAIWGQLSPRPFAFYVIVDDLFFVFGDHLLQKRMLFVFSSSRSHASKRYCKFQSLSSCNNASVQHTKYFLDFSDRQMRVCVHQSCHFVCVHRSQATRSLRVFSIKVSDLETRKPFPDHTYFRASCS